MGGVDFVVKRNALRDVQFVPQRDVDLGEGQVLLSVDKFAFTANNVTYAAFGDGMRYWDFFPAAEGWGRVPVWGYGAVAASHADGINVGERIYGYFPMSSQLVVTPGKVQAGSFVDVSAHRAGLPPVYNQYLRVDGQAEHAAPHDDQQMLFRPLFMTSFLIDDFLADENFFGAQNVVLSSASSKTALGTAFLLSRNKALTGKVIGLTSPGNVAFVEGLGCYDEVVTYDAIDTLDRSVGSVFVDFAGNRDVLTRIHEHLTDDLRYSCIVGATHWDAPRPADSVAALPGPAPIMFFAPDHIVRRTKDWGPGGLNERFGGAWNAFIEATTSWLKVSHDQGQDAVRKIYSDVLEGKAAPDRGYIVSLNG